MIFPFNKEISLIILDQKVLWWILEWIRVLIFMSLPSNWAKKRPLVLLLQSSRSVSPPDLSAPYDCCNWHRWFDKNKVRGFMKNPRIEVDVIISVNNDHVTVLMNSWKLPVSFSSSRIEISSLLLRKCLHLFICPSYHESTNARESNHFLQWRHFHFLLDIHMFFKSERKLILRNGEINTRENEAKILLELHLYDMKHDQQ